MFPLPFFGLCGKNSPSHRCADSVLALSVKAYRLCHLSQRERLWRNRELCTLTVNFPAMPRALPLGELARSA